MSENLLNNPKTFSVTEVVRALNFRHIFNAEDVTWMMAFSIVIVSLIVLAGTLLFYNELKLRKSKIPNFILLALSAVIIILTAIIIKNDFESLGAVGNSSHQWGLMRLFYLFDGVIIMAAFITNTSYEMINVIIFGIIQPMLIVFLFIIILRKQREFNKISPRP